MRSAMCFMVCSLELNMNESDCIHVPPPRIVALVAPTVFDCRLEVPFELKMSVFEPHKPSHPQIMKVDHEEDIHNHES